jgi:DNA-binding transcriptional LysR family regulator
MTIIQLETFLKITETRNFTTAANLLGYAQSTVTTQIKQLDEELGCLLFERLGKTIVPTAEGERLAEYAERMTQLQREIRLEIPGTQETAGKIRLGVSESLCYNRLPRVLMQFRQQYPAVEIQLSFIMHDTFPELLKKGALDIAYSLNPAADYPDLDILYEKPETLGFYTSPDHPLASRKKVTEEDLAGVPLLLTSHNCSFRHMLLEDLAGRGITPKIALETSSKEILRQFAANGLGIAFMPDMAAGGQAGKPLLKRLDWAGQDFPILSRVYIHRDKHRNFAIRELVRMIGEYNG